MSDEIPEMSERERQVNALIAAYLQAVDAGEAPERQEFLRRHAEFAAELEAFFADQDQMNRVAHSLAPEMPAALPAASAAGREVPTHGPGQLIALPTGTRVRYFGDYELLGEIARGGFGVVYRARQISLNRLVALKMILAGQLASSVDVLRFRTEAEAAANLEHPHIVPIYEVGERDGQHYFSMKLIEGGSLTPHLARLHKDHRAAALLLATTARAVHHAHQRGILHRDLKPGNILVDAAGQPHITDFGLAKRVTGVEPARLTQSGAIVGTPSYMAPEQASSKKQLTTAVDVYALGAILYELLTGRPPFQAETPLDTVLQVVEKEPERPRAIDSRIDRDLETICLKCLEKEPSRRYGSAQAFAEDLERWLAGEPILARPVGQLERAVKWARRRSAVAALLALVLVVTLLGVGLVTWKWQDAEYQKSRAQEQARQTAEALEQVDEARREAVDSAKAEKAAKDETGRHFAEAKKNLYSQQIALARQAWTAGNVSNARELLEKCPPDLRHWEWRFLRRLCETDLLTIQEPWHRFHCLAFSPDGQRLASDGKGNTVVIWDTATGKELRRLTGHTASIDCLAFSPDGKCFASGATTQFLLGTLAPLVGASESLTGEIKLWDTATGKEAVVLKGPVAAVRSLSFSPDGRHLAAGCKDKRVKVWDVTTGKQIATLIGHTDTINGVTFSPNGQRLASVADELKVWDVASWKEAFTPEDQEAKKGSECIVYSPDGHYLALAHRDNTVKVLDADTGRKIHSLQGHSDWVNSVAFSPDGRHLASGGGDRMVRLWDVRRGKEIAILRGHTSAVHHLAFHPDGRQLASLARASVFSLQGDSEIKLWDVTQEDQEALTLHGHDAPIRQVVLSPDGRSLASADAEVGAVLVWDTRTGKPLAAHKQQGLVTSLAFSSDGRSIASASVKGGGDFEDLFGMALLPSFTYARSIWQKNNEKIPAGFKLPLAVLQELLREHQGEVKLWDAANGKEVLALDKSPGAAYQVSFSPDGRRLAAACSDKTVKVWDTTAGRLSVLRGHKAIVRHLVFSPDSRLLASGSGDPLLAAPAEVKIWNLAEGREVCTVDQRSNLVTSIAFSPDGRYLASAGSRLSEKPASKVATQPDHSVQLWDAATGKEVHTLQGHAGTVTQVAFSPKGEYLASAGGMDGTVRLWSVATGQLLHTLSGHTRPVLRLAFSPDGQRLASTSSDLGLASNKGETKFWEVSSGREILTLNGTTTLTFSSDGRRLAAAGSYGTVKVWRAEELTVGERAARRTAWENGRLDWHRRAATESRDSEQWFAAIFHYSRLIDAEPKDVVHYFYRAVAYAEMEQWEKELADCSKILELDPDPDGHAYFHRGMAYSMLNQYDKAVADLTEAIKRKAKDPTRYRRRGDVYLHLHQYDKAAADYTEAIKRESGHWEDWSNRGEAYAALGQWDKAAADFARALKLKADKLDVWENQALIHLAKGNLDGYRKACAAILERFGETKDPELANEVAWVCVRVPQAVADPVRVVHLAFKEVEKKPTQADSLTTLGAALYRAGLFEAASSRLTEAAKLSPKEPLISNELFLAMTYHRLGQADKARQALDNAIRWFKEAEQKKTMSWGQRLSRQGLRREVEELLKGTKR
jgi:WD40 repeat protein/Flp pilus assembly protein TadD